MEYTSLPEMGMKVSRVALGGCPLGGHGWGKVEDADSITAVRTAFDEGVNFFLIPPMFMALDIPRRYYRSRSEILGMMFVSQPNLVFGRHLAEKQ